MAVKLATSSDYLQRTTNVVQPSSNYTCIFWVNSGAIATHPSYQIGFVSLDDPITYNYYAGTFFQDLNFNLQISNGSVIETTAPVIVANTWIPIAYTRSGNNHLLYVNGIQYGPVVLNISAGSFGYTFLGNDTYSNGNLQFFNFREWNVALTQAQVLTEINSPSAVVHSSGLVTNTPLTSNLLDISGNGNNWTAIGSPAFVATEPTFPANLSSATAIAISSLPYSNVQSNILAGAFCTTLWYSYTTVSGDNVLGPFAFGAIGGYAPICNILESDLSHFIVSANLPNAAMLLPSEANGTTYYFQIVPNAQGLSAASLTFSLVRHVDVTAPIGTVAISSDFDTDNGYDLPLALLNPNADGVLAFVNPFTVGEQGNILASGVLAVSDDDESSGTGHNIVIYNTSYAKTSTTALGAPCLNITSDAGQTTFYFLIKSGSNYDVKSINTSGTIGGTTYNLGTTAVHNIAVDPTNAYIYYQLTTSNTIKKWIIGTNSAGADLVTGVSAFPIQDLLCLTDGSIIAADAGGTARRYNSSGTLLNTYSVGTINAKARMCAGTDATYFVIYLTFVGNTVPLSVIQIRCSDGVVLNNQTYSTFEQGNNQMAVSATPVRFGPAQSCPIWVARTALTFTNSTIVVGKASNPLATGVTFMVNGPAGMFSIMTDTSPGQIINVAPGTYSIVEQPQANYNPSYFVSNDPVNNNNTAIVVGSSALVDVVILNTLSQKYGGLYTLVPGKQQDTLRNQDGSTVLKMINWFFELFTDRDK